MPSILLEIGFISNRAEAEVISRPAAQKKIAAGICDGVEQYLASLGTLVQQGSGSGGDRR